MNDSERRDLNTRIQGAATRDALDRLLDRHERDRDRPHSWPTLIKRLRYKPGTSFDLSDREEHGGIYTGPRFTIRLNMTVPDVDDPDSGPQPGLTQVTHVDIWPGLKHALQIIRELVRTAELHEAEEWLKLDDACVKNPHTLDGWLKDIREGRVSGD